LVTMTKIKARMKMNKGKSILGLVFIGTALISLSCSNNGLDKSGAIVDISKSRPGFNVTQRVFSLENGIEVLLFSDVDANKSAAALDMASGSFNDPENAPGTAHFLEHLLFMGTEKYPEVEDYKEYLSANQGYGNAYTDRDHTNYQFEVVHDGFEGALDRFSQFFISPLFNPKYVDRERGAVDSEHQKNLQSDFWRARQIKRMLHREGHPNRNFSTGNKNTLADITREDVVRFYEEHYSANQMKLCMLSNLSLDEMERLTREKFSVVKNQHREVEHVSQEVFNASDLPQLIQIEPVKDSRSMEITFALPPTYDVSASKPLSLLSSLIGHEGTGSLLSLLKKESLATSLSARPDRRSFTTYYNINMDLTESGQANTERIIELVFSYLKMLKDEGLQKFYYQEEKTTSELGYYFRDRDEGASTVSYYAAQMQKRPAATILEDLWLLKVYKPELFSSFIEMMDPEKIRVTVIAPGVYTDKTEQYYNSAYSVSRYSDTIVDSWKNVDIHPDLHYPTVNPYIADNLNQLEPSANCTPYKLIDNEQGIFWFEQDSTFKVAKGEISMQLVNNLPGSSHRNALLNKIYAKALNESINEWGYPARNAGLSYSFNSFRRGVYIQLEGFSQRLPALLADIGTRLKDLTISEKTFENLLNSVEQDLANRSLAKAYQQVFRERGYLMTPDALHADSMLTYCSTITLPDLKDYVKDFYQELAFEGAAVGNLKADELKAAVNKLLQSTGARVLVAGDRPQRARVKLPQGEELSHSFTSRSNNHCWSAFVEFGPRDPKLEAILRLGSVVLNPGFYGELRTTQQLGYIVFSGGVYHEKGQGFDFLVQSPQYDPVEISRRAWTWIDTAIPKLNEISDEEFSSMRDALIEDILLSDTNLKERLNTIYYESIILDDQLGWDTKVAEALRTLSKKEVAEAFKKAFSKDNRTSLSVYLRAAGNEEKAAPELAVDAVEFNGKSDRW
jgi:insulysin